MMQGVVVNSSRSQVDAGGRYIPLFWRLFIPNAVVLVAACIVLIVQPANGRVMVLVGGLGVMLIANVVLMRRAFAPLSRLIDVMEGIDPLRPGQRIPTTGPDSEVAVLAESFNEMLDRLETERRESARREVAAQEAERRHVASELHDDVGQNLTALQLQLGRSAARAGDPVRGDLIEARELAGEIVENVRGLARRLRPEVLDALGLSASLTNLCTRLSESADVTISRRIASGVPVLDPEAQLVVYRVAQESLTNVVRHAGAATAMLTLEPDGDGVVLTVTDAGAGFEPAALRNGGTGIRSMRERALLIGAELRVESAHGRGTAVTLRVPGEMVL
jgi:two-component system sensor histidine kinase UhpB